jgi:hypothetical protein
MTVWPGAGLGGSDRVELIWLDGAITNRWLQVTMQGNSHTNLAAPDVFYVGNAIGETGNDPANALVDVQDEAAIRSHRTGFTMATVTTAYDLNRDGRVNATDELIARHNVGGNPLQLIRAPTGLAGAMTAQKAATVGRAPAQHAATAGRAIAQNAATVQAHNAVLAASKGTNMGAETWLEPWAWLDMFEPVVEKKTAVKRAAAAETAAVDAALAAFGTWNSTT